MRETIISKKGMTKVFIQAVTLVLLLYIGLCTGAKESDAKSKIINLKANRLYRNFDLTGNGKKDSIRFTSRENIVNKNYYHIVKVFINGKSVYKNKSRDGGSLAAVKILKMKKKKNLIYVESYGEDWNGAREIISYIGGKMKKLCTISSKVIYESVYGKIKRITGNKIYVDFFAVNQLSGSSKYKKIYNYSKGKLILKKKVLDISVRYIDSIKNDCHKNQTLESKTKLKVYSKSNTESECIYNIKPGDKVTFMKIKHVNYRPWFKVLVNGKTGWLRSEKYDSKLDKTNEPDDNGCGLYFKNVDIPG